MPSSGPKDTPARTNTKRSGSKPHARNSSVGVPRTSRADKLRIQEFEEQQKENEWLASYTDWPLISIFALLILNLVFFAFCFLPKPSSPSKGV